MPGSGDLILFYFLPPSRFNQVTRRDNYPLHLTIVPWFHVPGAQSQRCRAAMREAIGSVSPFIFAVSEPISLGSADIAASTIIVDDRLMGLHASLAAIIEKVGGVFVEPAYAQAGYLPHISHTKKAKPRLGEKYTVTQLVLLELQANENSCRTIDVFELQGSGK